MSDFIKTNQELSKNKVNPIEHKTFIKQDRFIETTTTTNKESKTSGKKMNQMKHHLKSKVKNAIVNKTQVLVVLITTNWIKQKAINHKHQKLIIKKIINKSQL